MFVFKFDKALPSLRIPPPYNDINVPGMRLCIKEETVIYPVTAAEGFKGGDVWYLDT